MNTQAESFQWPRYVARMACGPAELRKKWAGRKVCGEYYHAPRPETAGTGRGFYLDSDGQPSGRWPMGEGMASTVDADLYDTAEDAAHAADCRLIEQGRTEARQGGRR